MSRNFSLLGELKFLCVQILYMNITFVKEHQKKERNVFQKIERTENCSFVKVQLYKGLFVFEIYSLLAAFQWPPGKSGFQVARCIAVYSNTFLYNMKANRDLKKNIFDEKQQGDFFGVFWAVFVELQHITSSAAPSALSWKKRTTT